MSRVLVGVAAAGAVFLIGACANQQIPTAAATSDFPTTVVATTAPPIVATTPPPAAITVVPTTVPPPAQASPSTCQASVDDSSPSDYADVDVTVQTGMNGADVSATAHYKTKDTTHTAVSSDGTADIVFRISDATVGYPVEVDVTVSGDGATQSCETSFTPSSK